MTECDGYELVGLPKPEVDEEVDVKLTAEPAPIVEPVKLMLPGVAGQLLTQLRLDTNDMKIGPESIQSVIELICERAYGQLGAHPNDAIGCALAVLNAYVLCDVGPEHPHFNGLMFAIAQLTGKTIRNLHNAKFVRAQKPTRGTLDLIMEAMRCIMTCDARGFESVKAGRILDRL